MNTIITKSTSLEAHFEEFRQNVIGNNLRISTPYGEKPLVYADWTASGRLYGPIENKLTNFFGPCVANTHTETNFTGTTMTIAYDEAKAIIKEHVNADSKGDVLLMVGSGMTGAINKLQRILGLKLHEKLKSYADIPAKLRPVVFVTHREHHSNEISWRETIADVEYIPTKDGEICLDSFEEKLKSLPENRIKIAAVCACSNVTGIQIPYHEIARLMHRNGGYCFVDFAASAPYISIDMHPEDPDMRLDAIYFSMHKFLGGPATPGVLIFNKKLYKNEVPDEPGGGTVKWVNPWHEQRYYDRYTVSGIEMREDGGTPAFMQTIKAALCVRLKDEMGVSKMLEREEEIIHNIFPRLKSIEGLSFLEAEKDERLAIFSFYLSEHPQDYNLVVKLLNDRFGIQVRGGCACAGPYGHCLLNIEIETSRTITTEIDQDNLSSKPGWVRLSLHPMTTDQEIDYMVAALEELVANFSEWKKDYARIPETSDYRHRYADDSKTQKQRVKEWLMNG